MSQGSRSGRVVRAGAQARTRTAGRPASRASSRAPARGPGTQRARKPAGKSSRGKTPTWKRIRWKRLILMLFGVFAFLYTLVIGALFVFGHVPTPNEFATAQSVVVVDDHGHLLGRIHASADRVSVPFSEMPADLRHAVIATEDRHFYQHHGIEFTSIIRAALANLFHRGIAQGGSTITQQYVKNAFVGNERSIWRKTKEAVLAIKLERKESKDEILRDYLNTIYFGRGAYGCEAAAEAYFGTHCARLTLPQASLLAGIIQAPSVYDPAVDATAAKDRRTAVLGFMVRDGYITQQQADAAARTAVRAKGRLAAGSIAPHFMSDLQQQLEDQFGARRLYSGEITRVVSTLDENMQRAADDAVAKVYPFHGDPQAALVAIDPHTGAVRAMVGSRSFATVQLNLATQGHRQPGSTFKPTVLGAWIDQGRSVMQTFPAPATLHIAGETITNYKGESYGHLSVEQATWNSVNTVYAQMIYKEGTQHAVDMAHALGITSRLQPQLGLTLGDQVVTPLELTNMYATLAARGERHTPYLIDRIYGRGGKVLFRAHPSGDQTVKRGVADAVNYVLQGVIRQGTGTPAAIGRPAAGKTGTTEQHADAWFAGYTPELAAVVWNGYAGSTRPMMTVKGVIGGHVTTITGGVYGASFPAAMWKAFMSQALAGLPATSFVTPTLVGASPTATPSPTPTPSPTRSASPSATATAPPKPPKPKKSPTPSPSQTVSPSPTATKK